MEKDYCNPSLVSTGMLTCTWAHLHLPMHPHTCTHTGTCIYTHKRHDEWHFCCTQRTHKPAFGCATGHSRGRQPCSMYLRGNTRCICPVSLLFKFQWSCKLWEKCSFHWGKTLPQCLSWVKPWKPSSSLNTWMNQPVMCVTVPSWVKTCPHICPSVQHKEISSAKACV